MTKKLIIESGGQTGVDRAALDFAIENDFPYIGWCPKGRLAEDGPIDKLYHLKETPSQDYDQRTEWNIRDSDGTILFSNHPILEGGTLYAQECAKHMNKPVILICLNKTEFPKQKILDFIKEYNIKKINIAGPRASKDPLIYDKVKKILKEVFLK